MTVLTPTLRGSLRRSLFWIGAVTTLIVVAAVVLVTRGASTPNGVYLSSTNPAPGGAMALAEVLQEHGVAVVSTDTLEDTRTALQSEGTTLLLHDDGSYLTEAQLGSIAGLAEHTVLIEPGFTQLQAIAPAVAAAGAVSGELAADCEVIAVVRAETVVGDGSGYRQIDDRAGNDDKASSERCLGSGDDVYSLIQVATDGRLVTVLGTSAALTNERVVEQGNAALAITLLGAERTLVWYQPSPADLSGADAPTIAELTPAWLSLIMALLLLVVVAAGVWKGRRLGPLVVENLPVTVPASETMEGRARLYQKGSARLRALDALRIGTIARLATACGLPRTASVEDVVGGAAAVTGREHGQLRRLLLETVPTTDRDLIRLSDELLTLERDVTRATRPGSDTPGAADRLPPTTHQGE